MNEAEPNSEAKPQGTPAEPKPEAAPAEPKPEATPAEPAPKAETRTPSDLTPQLINRVHALYEELGREEVRAVLAWEKAEREIRKDETEAEPKPEAKAAEPRVEPKAAEPKAGAKAAEPKPDARAAESKPETKAAEPKHEVRNKIIFTLSILGILAALVAAYLFGRERKAQPPVFKPVSNPYDSAIYANGIIESDQSSGENINIYPEVSGPITKVLVREGQPVSAGTRLFSIDDSVQRPNAEQLRSQSEASLALLNELKAQPRMETLAIAVAQVGLAESNLKVARDQYDKDRASYDIDPKSISKNVLDTAQDAVNQAAAALDVARKQYELTKAGAWSYDIDNQEKLYEALKQAYQAANALLVKYSVKAPVDGVVLAVNATVGSYVSSQGAYSPYTELFDPLVIMGAPQDYLAVRCYVDEILVSRLPSPLHIRAQMSIRGSYTNQVPLEFVRVQPYVSPKIELSNQRQEQVDLRVLPVIFRFQKKDTPVYPGQLVDVFIGQQ
ncbi:MAG: biotin/lipoyl-binding protein [Verrucomicrobiota bacterium]|jgi:HlyD family secretion protein